MGQHSLKCRAQRIFFLCHCLAGARTASNPRSLPEPHPPLSICSSLIFPPRHGDFGNCQDEQPELAHHVGPLCSAGCSPQGRTTETATVRSTAEFTATAVSLAVPNSVLGATDGQKHVKTLGQGRQSQAAGGAVAGGIPAVTSITYLEIDFFRGELQRKEQILRYNLVNTNPAFRWPMLISP